MYFILKIFANDLDRRLSEKVDDILKRYSRKSDYKPSVHFDEAKMSSKQFLEDPEYVPETPQSSQRNVLNSCKTDGLNKSKTFMETPSRTASGFDSRDLWINRFGSNKSHSLNRFYEPSHEDRCELRNRDDQKYVNTTQRSYEPRFHDKRKFRKHDDFVNTTPRFHDLSLGRCELQDRDISQRSHSDNSPFERKD